MYKTGIRRCTRQMMKQNQITRAPFDLRFHTFSSKRFLINIQECKRMKNCKSGKSGELEISNSIKNVRLSVIFFFFFNSTAPRVYRNVKNRQREKYIK